MLGLKLIHVSKRGYLALKHEAIFIQSADHICIALDLFQKKNITFIVTNIRK